MCFFNFFYLETDAGCLLQGCVIQDGANIQLGSVVSDGAIIGRNSVIAAGSFVPVDAKIPSKQVRNQREEVNFLN